MKALSILRVEILKVQKSKILFITVGFFILIPLMMALMMFVSKNPDIAAKLGLFGTKAKMFNENDWTGFGTVIIQSMASVGFIGYGFVTSWVFGREHSDRTFKDMLSLPVSRSLIVYAKMTVAFIWCLMLSAILFLASLLFGLMLDLPGLTNQVAVHFSKMFFMTSVLTLLLNPLIAFLSGYSNGIVAPLGFMIVTLIMANFAGLLGIGPYFPWSIPGLYSVASHDPGLQLHFSSYMILAVTFFIGMAGTLYWWKNADHK
ncbi:MAG TPA: ABC transporter permease [Bacteroidales bacterium]|nr:ABC transporter permease [Bacteroidales bacterium]